LQPDKAVVDIPYINIQLAETYLSQPTLNKLNGGKHSEEFPSFRWTQIAGSGQSKRGIGVLPSMPTRMATICPWPHLPAL
jgi:hypothetical protein